MHWDDPEGWYGEGGVKLKNKIKEKIKKKKKHTLTLKKTNKHGCFYSLELVNGGVFHQGREIRVQKFSKEHPFFFFVLFFFLLSVPL